MKKIYLPFQTRNSAYFIAKTLIAVFILSSVIVKATAQTSSNFTTVNWSTAAAQQYAVNEAQGRVVNGKLYTFGGFDSRKPGLLPTKRAYVFNPQTNVWSAIASLPFLPNGADFGGVTHAGIATDGTDIYLAGGVTADTAGTGSIEGTKQVWKYIVSQNTYTRLPDFPISIGSGQMEYLNGELHFFGGFTLDRLTDLATHYVLNLNNLSEGWTTRAPLPNPRQHAGSTVYGGKIYSVGGQIGEEDTLKTQKDLNVYDPATDKWTRLADMPVPSGATGRGHISSAVVVFDNRIIVLAGETVHKTGRTNMVSAYSPATNTWQNLTPLPVVRYSGVAAVLNSKIYYSGGSSSNVTYKGTPAGSTLSFDRSMLSFYITQDGTVASKTANISVSQGTPAIDLAKSSGSDWLILPSPTLGSLSFGINASGLLPGTYNSVITASAAGYSSATLKVTLTVFSPGTLVPIADAFVRDGSYAAINYGNDTSLNVKSSASSGYTRLSYLKFSLDNINSITAAKLRIFGSNTENTTGVNISTYGVDNDAWTETGITQNNAPGASTSALSSSTITNQKKYYELDVLTYIKAQLTGDKIASFLVKNPSNQNISLTFNSKENNQFPPQLVITPSGNDVIPPVVSIELNGTSATPGKYNNEVEIVINASDAGGSGLASTTYSLNGASFQTYNSSFIISTPGDYTIKAQAKDGNGNVTATNDTTFSIVSIPQSSLTLAATADSYIRNGSYAALNYGNDTTLVIKGAASGYTRFSYLKFSLNNISDITSAKLRLYGRNIDTASFINISAYGIDNDAWTESSITWNNAPLASTAALSSVNINEQAKYYELDVTNYVKTQFNGDKVVTLLIKDPASQNKNIAFNSKENDKNRPELLVTSSSATSALRTLSEKTFNSIRTANTPIIYPNPAKSRFNVRFPASYKGKFSLEIIDQSGRTFKMGQIKIESGLSEVKVDVSKLSLSRGIYFLKITPVAINKGLESRLNSDNDLAPTLLKVNLNNQ